MMRCTHLLLTCLLVSSLLLSQVQAKSLSGGLIPGMPSGAMDGIRGIPSRVMDGSFMFNKELEIEAKDIIVNIGKVEIEIEKDQGKEEGKKVGSADTGEAADTSVSNYPTPTPSTSIEKEIEIEAKDIIINIGKVNIEIEKDKHHQDGHHVNPYPPHSTPKPTSKPTSKPTYKPIHKPIGKIYPTTTGPIEDSSLSTTNSSLWEFEDVDVPEEPSTNEIVLGENATAITVQGGEHNEQDSVLILTGPQIFSVTFKIVKEKVITIKGSDLNVEGADGMDKNRKQREAVTFIIRGRGFTPGGSLFNELSDFVEGGGQQQRGMFSILEPQVFLGSIPLKVVRFTDTTILARFLDIEDQRAFQAGTFLARVKVIHIDLRKEKKKHGPGEDIGILGIEDGPSSSISGIGGVTFVPNGIPAVIAALNQRSLFTVTDGKNSIITSPVLGVIDIPNQKDDHHDDHNKEDDFSTSLLGIFSGLRFDTAVLAVQFSEKDAQKIRGASSTIFTDDAGLGFPDI